MTWRTARKFCNSPTACIFLPSRQYSRDCEVRVTKRVQNRLEQEFAGARGTHSWLCRKLLEHFVSDNGGSDVLDELLNREALEAVMLVNDDA